MNWHSCLQVAVIILLLASCSPARAPVGPPYCTGMLPDYDEAARVAYLPSARAAEEWLPALAQLDCRHRHCEEMRWTAALRYTTGLDHLDEPVVLSRGESYRLFLQSFYTLAMVRIEHDEGRSELMVKVARGASSWRPAVQTIRRRSRALSEREWRRVSQVLRKYGFWDQPVMRPPDGKPPVFDGMSAILEGFDSGKRHVIWRPLPYRDDKMGEIVDLFWELADCNPDEESE